MKCPRCGNELVASKKDSSYGLCHNCKKKYKLPSGNITYSNIPPKHIRRKCEENVKSNYQKMLDIEDTPDASDSKDRVLFTVMIVLFVLIVALAAYIFLFLK